MPTRKRKVAAARVAPPAPGDPAHVTWFSVNGRVARLALNQGGGSRFDSESAHQAWCSFTLTGVAFGKARQDGVSHRRVGSPRFTCSSVIRILGTRSSGNVSQGGSGSLIPSASMMRHAHPSSPVRLAWFCHGKRKGAGPSRRRPSAAHQRGAVWCRGCPWPLLDDASKNPPTTI